jgi:hypothetical protein
MNSKLKLPPRRLGLLCAVLTLSQNAGAVCNANIPLTRPDSRYQVVAGTTPANSELRDTLTGLIWKRCLEGYRWSGTICTIAGVNDPITYAWSAALNQPSVANAVTPTPATPWRLPSQAELRSLVERACSAPAHNSQFPYLAGDIWSSTSFVTLTNQTTQATTSDVAWAVNFGTGFDSTNSKSAPLRLRLVRNAP